MRLLMTTDTVGGVWTYAVTLARALAPLGVTTTLAVLGPPPTAAQADTATEAGATLVQAGSQLDWQAPDEATLRAIARRLADLAALFGPDRIQLNSPVLAAFARFPAPVIGVCHSCLATWRDAVHPGPLPADVAWRTAALARGHAACDSLVAPSAAFAAAIAARYGVHPLVVHNGSPAPRATPRTARDRLVLTAGRLWDEGKDFATLDAAAALIDAPVHAAGPLTLPPHNQVACTHAVALGTLTAGALHTRMASAAVFASLALYEPFGLAVLEAAQSGCALVLSDIPTFRELWDGAALFVPPRDAPAAAAALQSLLDDPPRRARIAAAAQASAARYTAPAMAEAMRLVLDAPGRAAEHAA